MIKQFLFFFTVFIDWALPRDSLLTRLIGFSFEKGVSSKKGFFTLNLTLSCFRILALYFDEDANIISMKIVPKKFITENKALRSELKFDYKKYKEFSEITQPVGKIKYNLISLKKDIHNIITLEINGKCLLKCMRCMRYMFFSINQKIIFIVSESIDKNIEIEIEKLFPDAQIDFLERNTKIDLLDLIIEQILLVLPNHPKHSDIICSF